MPWFWMNPTRVSATDKTISYHCYQVLGLSYLLSTTHVIDLRTSVLRRNSEALIYSGHLVTSGNLMPLADLLQRAGCPSVARSILLEARFDGG